MTDAERALVQIQTLIEDNDKTGRGYYEDIPANSINRPPKSKYDLLNEIKKICERTAGSISQSQT